MPQSKSPQRRTPGTANSRAAFLAEQRRRRELFPAGHPERAAIDELLGGGTRQIRALGTFRGRSHDATLSGAAEYIAKRLRAANLSDGETIRALAADIAHHFPDLHPDHNHSAPHAQQQHAELVDLLKRSLSSTVVGGVRYGSGSTGPHGPMAAAEEVVADVAGITVPTVRAARRSLGTLRRR
jgi:hypothetical protein